MDPCGLIEMDGWMDGWMDSIKSWWVNQLTHLGRWKWGTGKYRTKKAHNAWPV